MSFISIPSFNEVISLGYPTTLHKYYSAFVRKNEILRTAYAVSAYDAHNNVADALRNTIFVGDFLFDFTNNIAIDFRHFET